MPTSPWQIDALRLVGLSFSGVLLVVGMWVLWMARHRAEGERVVMPGLGRVGVPTCLVCGLSMLGGGYHVLAYSLLPRFTLWAVSPDRWWLVATVVAVAITGSLASDWLESRQERGRR